MCDSGQIVIYAGYTSSSVIDKTKKKWQMQCEFDATTHLHICTVTFRNRYTSMYRTYTVQGKQYSNIRMTNMSVLVSCDSVFPSVEFPYSLGGVCSQSQRWDNPRGGVNLERIVLECH